MQQNIYRSTILKNQYDRQKWISKRKTPLVLIYNGFLPNISNIVRNQWNILNISRTLQGLFQEEPITAFKRNKNLKELIGSNCIEKGKVKRAKYTFTIGKCYPSLSKTGNLCCSQLTSTTTFISRQTKKNKIYHKVKLQKWVCYLFDGLHAM